MCQGHVGSWPDHRETVWGRYEWSTTTKALSIQWHTTLNEHGTNEAFGIGYFSLYLYPMEDSPVISVEPSVANFRRILWGNEYNIGTTTCTHSGQTETVIGGYDWVGAHWGIRLRINSPRPFEKALFRFRMYFVDSWDREFVNLNLWVGGRPYLVYVDWSSHKQHKNTINEDTNTGNVVCGSGHWGDTYKPVYIPIILDRSQHEFLVDWSSTINQGAADESMGVAKPQIDFMPNVPTFVITDQLGDSSSKSGLSYIFNGAYRNPKYYSCRHRTVWGFDETKTVSWWWWVWGTGFMNHNDRLQYQVTVHRQIEAVRVFFNAFYLNSWDFEYAWLDFINDQSWPGTSETERHRVWRNHKDWEGWLSSGSFGGNWCSDDLGWGDQFRFYAVESAQFATPTRRVLLEWGSDTDEGEQNEGLGLVGWKVIGVTREVDAIKAAEHTFGGDGNEHTLDNWWHIKGNTKEHPDIEKCQTPVGPQYILGGINNMGPGHKLQFNKDFSPKQYKTIHVTFRFWFLQSWDNEEGIMTFNGQEVWRQRSVWNTHDSDINCENNHWRDTYTDYTAVIELASPTSSVDIVFSSTLNQAAKDESFGVSYLKLEFEEPPPSYKIQEGCEGRSFDPRDGLSYKVTDPKTSRVTSWGVGEMTNKHGLFDHNRVGYTDFALSLQGENTIVGANVALYKAGQTKAEYCCKIALEPGVPQPNAKLARPLQKRAVCHIDHDEVDGEIAFIAPDSSILYGSRVEIELHFYGTEANGLHDIYIASKGVSAFDGNGCANAGPRYNPEHWIGPEDSSVNGVLPFPGSGKINVGDLSVKHGKFNASSGIDMIYYDGQIALTGAHSVVGRTLVVTNTQGNTLACCIIGVGLVGWSSDRYGVDETVTDESAVDYADWDPNPDKSTERTWVDPPEPATTGAQTTVVIGNTHIIRPGDAEFSYIQNHDTTGGDSGLNGGEIAGIVIGSIVGVAALGGAAAFALTRNPTDSDYVAL